MSKIFTMRSKILIQFEFPTGIGITNAANYTSLKNVNNRSVFIMLDVTE